MWIQKIFGLYLENLYKFQCFAKTLFILISSNNIIS